MSRSASSTGHLTPDSTSLTPPTSTRPASRRKSSARLFPVGAVRRLCWRPRSASRWGKTLVTAGASRRRIIGGVEDSLRRLDTDWIDLYQIHRPDPSTDIDETLGALTDLIHQGKVRYVGHSTFPASQIVEAQWAARERNREPFRCEQPTY